MQSNDAWNVEADCIMNDGESRDVYAISISSSTLESLYVREPSVDVLDLRKYAAAFCLHSCSRFMKNTFASDYDINALEFNSMAVASLSVSLSLCVPFALRLSPSDSGKLYMNGVQSYCGVNIKRYNGIAVC